MSLESYLRYKHAFKKRKKGLMAPTEGKKYLIPCGERRNRFEASCSRLPDVLQTECKTILSSSLMDVKVSAFSPLFWHIRYHKKRNLLSAYKSHCVAPQMGHPSELSYRKPPACLLYTKEFRWMSQNVLCPVRPSKLRLHTTNLTT